MKTLNNPGMKHTKKNNFKSIKQKKEVYRGIRKYSRVKK
jgi:hypothetical protein